MNSREIKLITCDKCSRMTCSIKVYIKDGQLVEVPPDPTSLRTWKCQKIFQDSKGRNRIEHHYRPLRPFGIR